MEPIYSKFFILSSIVVLAYSCAKDKEASRDLDSELSSAIFESSNGKGNDFYILPESNDFSSIPQDPKNPLTKVKVELGKLLFHETQLATKPKYSESVYTYSCASCHHAAGGFQAGTLQGLADGGIGFGKAGEGRDLNPAYSLDSLDVQPIRTPTAMNGAYQHVTLWNGQFGGTGINIGTEANWLDGTPIKNNEFGYEGLEIQAIAGLTVHRMEIDTNFIFNSDYKLLFDYAFPERVASERYTKETAGLAIAAYERTLLSNQAPFQDWLKGNKNALTESQKRGAILFFGKAECVSCHSGPALNSMEFYALGMKDLQGPGVYGNLSDIKVKQGRGGFTGKAEDMYKFKVPQLYSLTYSPFYGHGGSFSDIHDVVQYKNKAVPENADVPTGQIASQFQPLNLTSDEVQDITNFIANGLNDNNLQRYEPSILPSGNCFPNNDPLSKIDLGCS